MQVKITFTEPLLGTLSGNKNIAKEFILSKGQKSDEEEALEKQPEVELEKSCTIFATDENSRPFLWDYQIKGFFKDAAGMLNRAIPKEHQLKAYKKIIDGLIFTKPRKMFLNLSGELGWLERPLRAQTTQGERIALARSQTAPIGTNIEFEINCLDSKLEKSVLLWLDYGQLRGLGQWRNASFGRFTFEIIQN